MAHNKRQHIAPAALDSQQVARLCGGRKRVYQPTPNKLGPVSIDVLGWFCSECFMAPNIGSVTWQLQALHFGLCNGLGSSSCGALAFESKQPLGWRQM